MNLRWKTLRKVVNRQMFSGNPPNRQRKTELQWETLTEDEPKCLLRTQLENWLQRDERMKVGVPLAAQLDWWLHIINGLLVTKEAHNVSVRNAYWLQDSLFNSNFRCRREELMESWAELRIGLQAHYLIGPLMR